jgi:hypothetical protein
MTKMIQREILIPQPRDQVWRVSFRLEPDGQGPRLLFEHSGFDVSLSWVEQALRRAEFGWAKMLGKLPAVAAGLAAGSN